jgi:ribosomal protein S18 acetylase RimI-like enzyme
MSAEIVIRRVTPSENDSVHALVQAIADETSHTYSRLLRRRSTMTRDEWVSDLWVRRDSRGTGIGGALLAHAEREIRGRRHDTLHLRVVKSNTRAVEFYQNHGWRVQREFPHEKFGHTMFEMIKSNEMLPVS